MGPFSVPNIIAGREVWSLSDETRPVTAPATGRVIGRMAWSTAEDVELACSAAADAGPEWAALGFEARSRHVRRWAERASVMREDLARADAIDSGSPIRATRASVKKAIDYLDFFAGLWPEVKGETIPATAENLHFTLREPFGIVGLIIPFNNPALFALSKSVPALLAGNTVVMKPSELTPVTAYMVGLAAAEILPPGVLNIVQGGPDVGRSIVRNARIRRIHFTGGVITGLDIQRTAAESGIIKQVTLELGGKNPLIVFPDVDPAIAAKAAVDGMNYTRNQGQSCGSTSRLFVNDAIADEVVELARELVRQIRLGLPEREDTDMGSLVSHGQQKRVLAAVEEGRLDGASLIVGGDAPGGSLAAGAFVEPTVLDKVTGQMNLAREEIFGPVLSIIRWRDVSEMVRNVNDSRYGLAAAIYTSDIGTALKTVRSVDAGYIWVNGVETRWKAVPFGGYKDSGIGSEHDLSELLSYTRTKTVNIMNCGSW